MSASEEKWDTSSKKMPLSVYYVLFIQSILILSSGVFFLRREVAFSSIKFFYFFLLIQLVHLFLFAVRSWRAIFSYGLAYSSALTVLSLALLIGFLEDGENAPHNVYYMDLFRRLHILPPFMGLDLQIVVFAYFVAVCLTIASAIVYYTSILDESLLMNVRTGFFICINRLIVVLASLLHVMLVFTMLLKLFIKEPYTMTIFSRSIIFNVLATKYELYQSLHITLSIILILAIVLIRPTSPVRSRFSKTLRVIILMFTSAFFVYRTVQKCDVFTAGLKNPGGVLLETDFLLLSFSIVFSLITLLEMLLPCKHYSILQAKRWTNLTAPYTSQNI